MKKSLDIIVATYNRPDLIRQFIDGFLKLSYPNLNLYIIDDCSNLSYRNVIPVKKNIHYFKLEKNKGQTFARNYGIKKSTSEIIIFMDDDAIFQEVDSLNHVHNYFDEDNVGGIMFNIIEPNRERLSKRFGIKDGETIGTFVACACAFSRTGLSEIGNFSDYLHSYGEETDIVLKMIRIKKKMIFSESIMIFHDYSPNFRSEKWFKRFKKNSIRNDLLVVVLRYPLLFVLPYIFGKFFSHLRYSAFKSDNKKAIIFTVLGFFEFFQKLPLALKHRLPLSCEDFLFWIQLKFR